MTSGQGQGERSAGLRRLALLAFASLLVLLFLGFAIAQGIGQPSIPSGDVALVEDAADAGNVSQADFDHALVLAAAQAGEDKAPKPGDVKYEELKETALSELLDQVWLQGQAEELGISVTPKQIATELAQIKNQNFKNETEYEDFLKTSRLTKKDVLIRVKLQILSERIQKQVTEEGSVEPSGEEIERYYEAAKSSEFTTAESRDVRVIVNKDKAKTEEAKALLEKDSSPASWKKVAAKFSEDLTTKGTGGVQRSLTEELLASQPDLKNLVFGTAVGVIAGPTDINGKFFVLQVEKLNPGKVQNLKEVSAQIQAQLKQQITQQFFSAFALDYGEKWTSRTFCASGFITDKCANSKSEEKVFPTNAGCDEENPETPPAACPAAVQQRKVVPPGSVTLMKPEGEPLAQQPIPLPEEPPSSTDEAPIP